MRALCQIFKRDDQTPFEYADTQLLIIAAIAGRIAPRIQLVLPTQYGKSEAVAQGILLRVTAKPEKWCIVAPTSAKAEIIMGYILKHIFDHPLFEDQLIFDEAREKLKQHKSKDHLTFKGGGEIMVLSADSRNRQRTKETMMGFGAPNVVIDESALIEDDLYSTIKRMVGGHASSPGGTFILEIGNPFTRGHFLRTWVGGRYHRIWVDYNTALAEGRYTKDFVEEMRDEAFFDVLYECKFPDGDEIRADGYRRLVANATLENALIEEAPRDEKGELVLANVVDEDGEPVYAVDDNGRPLLDANNEPVPLKDRGILGYDVAAGGENESVGVVRYPQSMFAMVVERNHIDDLDDQADTVAATARKWDIADYRIGIDDGGVGQGVSDSLKNHHDEILFKRVNNGETPHRDVTDRGGDLTPDQKRDRLKFANTKAMMNWRARQWLKNGGKIVKVNGLTKQVEEIYYKQNSSGKLQMEPKEKMRERGVLSPDIWDAFVNTFIDVASIVEEDDIYVD